MTDLRESPEDAGDDATFEEIFSILKRVEPPLEAKVAIRRAVADAMSYSGTARRKRDLPWWRHSISVPVPIAACLFVLVALATPSIVRGLRESPPDQSRNRVADISVRPTAPAKRPNLSHTLGKYSESETYLCEIGRVKHEARYLFEESNP